MNEKELIQFYEKLYFHELEMREKIVVRLQLPFAMLLALVGFLGYLINNFVGEGSSIAVAAFWLLLVVGGLVLAKAIQHFIAALWGQSYECLPDAKSTDDYKKSLDDFYEEPKKASESFDDYMLQYFRDCSSSNTKINDKRSLELHNTYSFIIYSIAPLILTFLVFHFGNLDRGHIEKVSNVHIVNPIKFEVMPMNDEQETKSDTARTPPPPPPKRIIKEDAPHKRSDKTGESSDG